MRKVILTMHISLDGYVGGPNGEMDWASMSEEIDDSSLPELMARADTCLIGRTLYQGFSSYWPTAPQTNPNLSASEIEFAAWIDRVEKVVFSKTLEQAEWNNARLVRGDAAEEVRRLKQQPGKDMVLFGGARTAQELVRRGLVDEYDLLLNPIILGQGLPLFKEQTARQKLKLVSTRAFESGAVALRYVVEESGSKD
jgi:dihydrofolate reductase